MVVYIEPKGKQRPRFVRTGGYVRTYTPKQTEDYEKLIAKEYIKQDKTYYDELPVMVTIRAFFEIPKSWSKKKQTLASDGEIKPTKKCDIDNIVKSVLDALNGVAYKDDKQVISIYSVKKYSCAPRIEIDVKEIKEWQ